MTERPAWARWSEAGGSRPWTVGIEEEVMLLDDATWSVANRFDDVLTAVPQEVARRAAAETHACIVELRTDPHPSVARAAAQLAHLREMLDATARVS